MKLLSRLLMRVAFWLSPLSAITFSRTMESKILQRLPLLEMLYGRRSSPLSTAPATTENMDSSLETLENEIAQQELREATARAEAAEATRTYSQLLTLPHRTYSPRLSHDGIQWVAVAEFQSGDKLVGRGDSPQQALIDYDNQWLGIKGDQ